MDDICLEEIAPEMSSLASPIIPRDFSDLIEIDVSRFPGMDDLDSRLVWLLQKHADPTPGKKSIQVKARRLITDMLSTEHDDQTYTRCLEIGIVTFEITAVQLRWVDIPWQLKRQSANYCDSRIMMLFNKPNVAYPHPRIRNIN